jgi:hypothetical protein
MVFNSQMYPKDSGWLYAESGVSNPSAWYREDRDIVTDPTGTWWVNPGIMSLVQTDGSLTGFSYTFQKTMMAIDSTKRYQFGALTGAHRCDGYVGVQLFAADRATLLATVQSAVNTSLKQGGNTISGYFDHTRFLEPADIPAGASYARLILLKDPTYSGASPASSYFFCTHAHFCEVKFGQTTFTPYSPGFESIGQNNPIQPNTRSTYIKDLTVDTAAIADLAVDTLKVAGQAITTPVSNAATLALSLNYDWTPIISKSIAITSTQSVSASIAVNGYLSISGGVGGTSGGTAEIRILKNDSVLGPPILYSQSWGFEYAGESSSYPLSTGATYVDTAPPLNQTVTYQIQGRRTGNGNASITYASIVIMNVKK